MSRISVLHVMILSGAFGALAGAQQPVRNQGTRSMHVACVGADSNRIFRRGVGDSLRVDRSRIAAGADTGRIRGGTARSREWPEYDVVLDIPNLCVERIFLKVDSLTAKINLDARVSNLVHVAAGADVLIGNVDLTIQDVRARALLLVDLDDVVHIVDQTLTFVDNHPEIIDQLGSTLQNTVGAVGGLVNKLLMSVTQLGNGNVLQRVVDQVNGSILERTLNAAGQVLGEKAAGSITQLQTLKETTNAAGQLLRQVRDRTGSLLEYTFDKAANKVLGVRVLQAARPGA